jgi:hypothetical protein
VVRVLFKPSLANMQFHARNSVCFHMLPTSFKYSEENHPTDGKTKRMGKGTRATWASF